VNLAAAYVRLALDERVEPLVEADAAEDWYIVRDYDSAPTVLRAGEFFTGIDEAL